MGKANCSDEFIRDAVAQITERGYPVAKVAPGDARKDSEIRQLKRELALVTEERDILKKPPRISPGM